MNIIKNWQYHHAQKYYVYFCKLDNNRFKEALILIKGNNELSCFLAVTLIEGAKIDIEFYQNEAINFLGSDDIEIRKAVITALGNIISEQSFSTLESVLKKENDVEILATLIFSVCQFHKLDSSMEERVVSLIKSIIDKNNSTLQLTKNVFFGFLPFELLNIYFSFLSNNLTEESKSVLDCGIYDKDIA
jgi:hypothetical protein